MGKKPILTQTSGNAVVTGDAKIHGEAHCFYIKKKPTKVPEQPKSIRISLELRHPLLRKYLARKHARELRYGGKLSHNLIIAEIIAEVLDPPDPPSD